MPKVEGHKGNPCWQQKQIAAQRSYLETVATGKDVIYAAPCAVTSKAS